MSDLFQSLNLHYFCKVTLAFVINKWTLRATGEAFLAGMISYGPLSFLFVFLLLLKELNSYFHLSILISVIV